MDKPAYVFHTQRGDGFITIHITGAITQYTITLTDNEAAQLIQALQTATWPARRDKLEAEHNGENECPF